MASFSVVADLGGTNVRFCVTDTAHSLGAAAGYRVSQFSSFEAALERFLADHCDGAAPDGLAIGAAGPVSAGRVKLTNAAWEVSADGLARRVRAGVVILVNDLQAVARAVPELVTDHLVSLRGGAPGLDGAEVCAIAINVGTGFGAAPLHRFKLSGRPVWVTTATEAGHMSDPLAAGRGESGTSLEDLLSGRGVAAAAKRAGLDGAAAEAVFQAAASGDAAARSVADRFGLTLGRATRDLVLAHGAWSGAFLVGSVVRGWHESGAVASFSAGYDADGLMAGKLSGVPVSVVTHAQPALLGLSHMLTD